MENKADYFQRVNYVTARPKSETSMRLEQELRDLVKLYDDILAGSLPSHERTKYVQTRNYYVWLTGLVMRLNGTNLPPPGGQSDVQHGDYA